MNPQSSRKYNRKHKTKTKRSIKNLKNIGTNWYKNIKRERRRNTDRKKRVKMLLEQKTLINIVRGLKKQNFVKKT